MHKWNLEKMRLLLTCNCHKRLRILLSMQKDKLRFVWKQNVRRASLEMELLTLELFYLLIYCKVCANNIALLHKALNKLLSKWESQKILKLKQREIDE